MCFLQQDAVRLLLGEEIIATVVVTPLLKTTVTSLKQLTKEGYLVVAPSSHKSDGLISPILPRGNYGLEHQKLPCWAIYSLKRYVRVEAHRVS